MYEYHDDWSGKTYAGEMFVILIDRSLARMEKVATMRLFCRDCFIAVSLYGREQIQNPRKSYVLTIPTFEYISAKHDR